MGVLQLENETERKRGLRRIEAHTGEELSAAINAAANKFGLDFWMLLHGIDAYMERRKRRDKRRQKREVLLSAIDWAEQEGLDNMWGHS